MGSHLGDTAHFGTMIIILILSVIASLLLFIKLNVTEEISK